MAEDDRTIIYMISLQQSNLGQFSHNLSGFQRAVFYTTLRIKNELKKEQIQTVSNQFPYIIVSRHLLQLK